MDDEIKFDLGDKLPWLNEAVIAIYNVAPGGSPKEKNEKPKRKKTINAYIFAVQNLWEKAFGKAHVCERKTVGRKLRAGLGSYYNIVVCNNLKLNLTKRELVNKWKLSENVNVLLDLLKPTSKPGEFDEICFTSHKKSTNRTGFITDEVDTEYEESRTEERNVEVELMEVDNEDEITPDKSDDDEEFVDEDEDARTTSNPSDSVQLRQTRSGTVLTHTPQSLHTDTPKPSIRKKRNCTDKIKAACSKVSYECGISVEKARKAVQIVCKELYSHDYFLNLEEKETVLNPDSKRARLENDEKTRITDIDYEKYSDIIPSAKAIRNYKSLQATQEETKAAVSLHRKNPNKNVTLHYDTTSRNCIDGEWPALILNFAEGERFNLRPVFFAYEDRENIAKLVAETYKRLDIAAEIKLSEPVSAKSLWEKTNNIMTDSVTKNLGIGSLIAKKLGSEYVPNALLCNAHVVEKFDATNLKVLADIERNLKLRERLEKINPSLRPFFRGKKAIVVAGMYALLKLITYDKSGSTVSLAEEFDDLLEREGLAKHMVLYHERRFTNLGYSAASILCALPQLQRLLSETCKTNLLIEACRLYTECELFIAELHVLAVFTKKVTLPFLNCLEKSTQKDLVSIFPCLYDDLLMHRTDTLNEFAVEYRHVDVAEITDENERIVLNRMCEEAAKGLDMQRGKEYGFGVEHPERETTELHKLSESEIESIDVVHNLHCERLLGTFGHRAVVAKFRNKTFTAQGIHDDLVLTKSEQTTVESTTRKINKILKEKESDWTQQQKELRSQRIQKKLADSQSQSNYTKKLLQSCKSWGGPASTPNELDDIISKRSDIVEKIVKTELSYYCKTHESERRANPEMFKIMIPHDQRLENLLILLGDNTHVATSQASSVLDLPTMKELEVELGINDIYMGENDKQERINETCIVVWLDEVENKPRWHVGFVTSMNGEKYVVEHLVRVDGNCDDFWKNPASEQKFEVEEEQILNVKINGDWEVEKVSGNRVSMRYRLKNSKEIDNAFKKMEG